MAKNMIRFLCFLAVLCYTAVVSVAYAQATEPRLLSCQASYSPERGVTVALAKFDLELSDRFSALLQRGFSLYFTTEFNLKRTRRYWWDEPVLKVDYAWRLSFHALTRKYRLSKSGVYYSFSSVDEALTMIKVVTQWKVADSLVIDKNSQYVASIRFHLDETKLPKLLFATPLISSEWLIDSGWRACNFTVHEGEAK